MSDLISLYKDQPEVLVYGSAAICVGLLIISIALRYWFRSATRRRIKSVVRSLGGQAVQNVALSDGVDGTVQIDFLVYSQGRLIVLNIQDYPGMIFGGEKVDQWTQMFEGKSYKFVNPLHYHRLCVQAAKERFPMMKVYGQVVFSHHGEFPKGIPEGVSPLNDLAKVIGKIKGSVADHDAGLLVWQDYVNSLDSADTRIYKMQSA